MIDERVNMQLDPSDFDGRLKDLERRVHTLEDRHEDIVRATKADVEAIRTLDGNPPPEKSVSDREREAEGRAATGRAHSDTRTHEQQAKDRAKGGDMADPFAPKAKPK